MVTQRISKTNIVDEFWKSFWTTDTLFVAVVVAFLFTGCALWDHASYSQCHNRASAIRGSVDHEYGRGYFVRDHQGKRLDMGHF